MRSPWRVSIVTPCIIGVNCLSAFGRAFSEPFQRRASTVKGNRFGPCHQWRRRCLGRTSPLRPQHERAVALIRSTTANIAMEQLIEEAVLH